VNHVKEPPTRLCTYGIELGKSRFPRMEMVTLFSVPKLRGVLMLYVVPEEKMISELLEQFLRRDLTATLSSTPEPPKGTVHVWKAYAAELNANAVRLLFLMKLESIITAVSLF